MVDVTVKGGSTFPTSLSQSQAIIASSFLKNIGPGGVTEASGGGHHKITSANSALIVDQYGSTLPTTLVGSGKGDVLIGNQGNDLIELKNRGSVVAGDGNDTVNSSYTGTGNAIVLGDGNDSIVAAGFANVTVGGGSDQIKLHSGGTITETGSAGHDTISIGAGKYTINEQGQATVKGAGFQATVLGGTLSVHNPGSQPETISAGSGFVTIRGSTNEVLSAGSGSDSIHGAGNDTFTGGYPGAAGDATMFGAGTANLFKFGSSGGSYTVLNFQPGDFVELKGLTAAAAFGDAQVISGVGVVMTDGSTTITLKGVYDLTVHEFKNG
jgi:hypothetical protein